MKKIESKVIKYNILSNERNKLESFNHLNTEPTNDTNTNYNEINQIMLLN